MNLIQQYANNITRRHFLQKCQMGIGSMALGSMMASDLPADGSLPAASLSNSPKALIPAKAKHIIFLSCLQRREECWQSS